MNDLSELTLEGLALSLRSESASSVGVDAKAWETLIQIADELNSADRIDVLTVNRRWQLKRVSVVGFRGAKHEVSLSIDSRKGLTVLFGENGSGKSSLAEAVRVAPEGRTGATHLGANGTVHELWGASDQRSQGVDEATVNLSLVDEATNDVLAIRAVITAAGVKRIGTLVAGGVRLEFENESPVWNAWSDAIRASPPVLAYAELADELQKKKDLQIWLSSCLAMDNASRVFDSRVKAQVDEAVSAQNAILAAQKSSARAAAEADDVGSRRGVQGIEAIAWSDPMSRKEMVDWLNLHELTERKKPNNHIDADILSSIPKYGVEFKASYDKWSQAATTALLTAQVTDSLVDMNARVINSGQGDNDGVCPTCGTSHTDWRRHLREQASKLKAAQDAARELKTLVRRCQAEVVAPLSTCLLVLPPEFDHYETRSLRAMLEDVMVALRGNDYLEVELLTAIHNLYKWSERLESLYLMEAAIAASGLEHQWRCDRWDAVAPYVSVFETNIDQACKVVALKRARGKWNSHLAKIRAERSASLHALVGPAVAALLGDVGISVSTMNVLKADNRLELRNAKNEPVELAHLSAGQRNALILGPVIATAESGIFAFSILDDPVHAFDDFRVDKLSSTLAEIGKNQSLVLTTHDARFVEYLRVHASISFAVLATSRDSDGQISLMPTLDPPAELIKFGRELASDLTVAQAPEGRAEITALLRMALDEAFEHVALRHFARIHAAAAKEARAKFEQAMLTRDRKAALRVFLSDSPAQLALLTSAWQLVATSAKRWSDSVHDPAAVPDADQLASDIDTAEQTIDTLRKIRW